MKYKLPKGYEPEETHTTETVLALVLGTVVALLIIALFFTWNDGAVRNVRVETDPLPEATHIGSQTLEDLTADAAARGQFHFVPSSAVASTILDVTDCEANPEVLEVSLGDELVIQNSGDEDVTLQINAEDFLIPAGDSLTTTTEFGKGAMAYGYTCSLKTHMAGVIVVTAQ